MGNVFIRIMAGFELFECLCVELFYHRVNDEHAACSNCADTVFF